ncbi:hypothetical protein E4U61_000038 [Claviceps capensis]|nr:hypothetical protein E4U61_000038 [Claviceps capensis]
MAQKPDANWDRVATDLGLGPQECQLIAKCAKECFRQMSVMVGETRVVGGAANAVQEGAGVGAGNGSAVYGMISHGEHKNHYY